MNKIRKLKNYVYLIRLNKPFLAIPFAVTAAFLACTGMPDRIKIIGMLIAVFSGFFAGNAFNAVTDRELDRRNPRSAERPVASGQISVREALFVLLLSVLFVIAGTAIIAWYYVLLLPIPLLFCLGYSLSKRYTWLCHIILGITNAICPVASWGVFYGWKNIYLWLMGAIVFCWTIGFELLYSSQDVEYDRMFGTKSIPSVFGCAVSYKISHVCHVVMFVLWGIFYAAFRPGTIFGVGLLVTAPIMIYEHTLVKDDIVQNPALAFDLNQVYSIFVMVFAVLNNVVGGYK